MKRQRFFNITFILFNISKAELEFHCMRENSGFNRKEAEKPKLLVQGNYGKGNGTEDESRGRKRTSVCPPERGSQVPLHLGRTPRAMSGKGEARVSSQIFNLETSESSLELMQLSRWTAYAYFLTLPRPPNPTSCTHRLLSGMGKSKVHTCVLGWWLTEGAGEFAREGQAAGVNGATERA